MRHQFASVFIRLEDGEQTDSPRLLTEAARMMRCPKRHMNAIRSIPSHPGAAGFYAEWDGRFRKH